MRRPQRKGMGRATSRKSVETLRTLIVVSMAFRLMHFPGIPVQRVERGMHWRMKQRAWARA